MSVPSFRRAPLSIGAILTALLFAATMPVAAQTNGQARNGGSGAWDPQAILDAETFVRPPANVERIILTPRTDISFNEPGPRRTWFMRTSGPDRGSIKAYGQPHIYLAGVQVDTRANRARSLTTARATGIVLVNPSTGAERRIRAPEGATISAETWSPDGSRIAYIANFDDASYVYVADVESGRSTQLTRRPLLATLVTSVRFTADGRQVIAVLVPEDRGAAPTHGKDGVEDGPQVRRTGGRAVPQPVHASLLEDPHDKALLKYHTTGQLALIDVRSRRVRNVGEPAMFREIDASPDGSFLRVTRMVEPFSYLVQASSFPRVVELWDASGKLMTTLDSVPVREVGRGGPRNAGPSAPDTGRRDIEWNPVGPGLVYLQSVLAEPTADSSARDARASARGGARRQVAKVLYVQWTAPFTDADTTTLYSGGPELTNVAWSADGGTMFINEGGDVSAVRMNNRSKKYALGEGVTLPGGGFGRGRGFGARDAAPDTVGTGGSLAMRRGPNGQSFVILAGDGRSVFVSGEREYGADWHTRAPRPWADRLDFETGTRTRIFDSPAETYDDFVVALDDNFERFIFTRQSPTMVEDAYLRDTKAGTTRKLTNAVDAGPEVSRAVRKRIQVTRPRDGTKIWVDVTLPRDWYPGMDLPGIIWFYPREYSSAEDYQRSKYGTNINLFPATPSARPASTTEMWVAGGYAFIEPDIPIFGDSGRMNENFTRDLPENLDAVLDAIVDSGFVDRHRMGIGGHSYGAFGVANAMTLVPYFKAGIAGDGMYNRSLTPFGFQSERRNFFEAQDVYLDVSPFLRADQLSGALLMYHGGEDQNQGTALLSSIRMQAALQGLGKTAALYVYPYEDHSVATYESDLDQWARWFAWFDVYVKNAGEEPTFTP